MLTSNQKMKDFNIRRGRHSRDGEYHGNFRYDPRNTKGTCEKKDIKDLVRSVIVEIKEAVKNKMKEEIKEEIMKDLLRDLNTEMHQGLQSYTTQHDEHLSKIRQQLADRIDSFMIDDDTNMDNISKLKNIIQKLENQ